MNSFALDVLFGEGLLSDLTVEIKHFDEKDDKVYKSLKLHRALLSQADMFRSAFTLNTKTATSERIQFRQLVPGLVTVGQIEEFFSIFYSTDWFKTVDKCCFTIHFLSEHTQFNKLQTYVEKYVMDYIGITIKPDKLVAYVIKSLTNSTTLVNLAINYIRAFYFTAVPSPLLTNCEIDTNFLRTTAKLINGHTLDPYCMVDSIQTVNSLMPDIHRVERCDHIANEGRIESISPMKWLRFQMSYEHEWMTITTKQSSKLLGSFTFMYWNGAVFLQPDKGGLVISFVHGPQTIDGVNILLQACALTSNGVVMSSEITRFTLKISPFHTEVFLPIDTSKWIQRPLWWNKKKFVMFILFVQVRP